MGDYEYSPSFFDQIAESASNSARIVVPIIIETIHPASVIDIGCGDGTWLQEFIIHGVERVFGLDGPYVEHSLKIDPACFLPCDLNSPPVIGKTFDLAVSLEVAEHLQASSAEKLVDFLTTVSDIVLFSAAIPYQGGTNHINLQWQTYWASLFQQYGFLPVTTLRTKIWDEPSIPYWYKQNMILYVRAEAVSRYPALIPEISASSYFPLSVVHPDLYMSFGQERSKTLLDKLRLLVSNQFSRFLSGISGNSSP